MGKPRKATEMGFSNGSFRLFRLFGITVYLHWSWLVYAYIRISANMTFKEYQHPGWYVLDFLTIFAIVLTHEFGHSLACRSVGGQADTIMLWPLGGVAFVNPPMRPGAMLWSIFAGPMVNMILVPFTMGLATLVGASWPWSDLATYADTVMRVNLWLMIFNLLPIYPLDGGQILQSLLWFVLGYVRSLLAVSVVGLVGAAALVGLALKFELGIMAYVIAFFIGSQALLGFQRAQAMARHQQQMQQRRNPVATEFVDAAATASSTQRYDSNNPPQLPPFPQQRDEFRPPPGI